MKIRFAAVLVVLTAGCRTAYRPEVVRGPATLPASATVVLFSLPCRSSENRCEPGFSSAITSKVRSELEFAGYHVIDGERLVADARQRDQVDAQLTTNQEPVAELSATRRTGSLFEDLPPEQQRKLLASANAQGVVTGSIHMLARDKSKNWLTEVHLRHANERGETVWVARCKHESFWNESNSWSIEQAAQCALDGALKGKPTQAR